MKRSADREGGVLEQGQSMTASVKSDTPEYHVGSRRMRTACQRPRGFSGNGGTGGEFQMTPDVAGINALV